MLRGTHKLSRKTTRLFHTSTKKLDTSYGSLHIPKITNEPTYEYAKGSKERELLLRECTKYTDPFYKPIEIPLIINGEEYRTGDTFAREFPSHKKKVLYNMHLADEHHLKMAIEGSIEAKFKWEQLPLDQKIAIFLKAADLLSGKYRYKVLASCMMGQGKTMYQAEIDAACETIDFWRFNALYASQIYDRQPQTKKSSLWNKTEFRSLEGFVAAISPFNFTAIGSNLVSAPALMGNVVLWKPSHAAALSNYYIYQILKEAGMPDGVIQFVPSEGPTFGQASFSSPHFSCLHFTGGTKTFQMLYKQLANSIETFNATPRVVAETGGKNFHVMHESANIENFVHNTIRGAFEYSGQKCSAASRVYVPKSKWNQVREMLVEEVRRVKVGQPEDPSSFTSCVIDKNSFDKISGFLERARNDPDIKVLCGGHCDDSVGYFVDLTVLLTSNPKSETMCEEIFGPVVTVYVYDDSGEESWIDVLKLVDSTSPYGLTGAVFATDRYAIMTANKILRHSSGNFYINDKSTGAVVGQQPFGGGRVSGTNDKAGSEQLLWRFTSVRTIKENFGELTSWKYPSTEY
ncbi:delta-1-pyrroline-5-carboxylate dehydrogenase [Acrasis kona]|uniref:Multifunctional fusion protein n=1 Tax=Acrasis kona TaxID=1008807 RepID=A0AAW2ZH65_9EUKA